MLFAKKLFGTLRVRVLAMAGHVSAEIAGIRIEVVNAKTTDCAVSATRLSKGIVIETSVTIGDAIPIAPVSEQAAV